MEKVEATPLQRLDWRSLVLGLGSVWLAPLLLAVWGYQIALGYLIFYVVLTALIGWINRRSPYYMLYWLPATAVVLLASAILVGPFAFFTLTGKATTYASYGIEMPNANIAMVLFAVMAHYSLVPLAVLWVALLLGLPRSYSAFVFKISLLNLFLFALVTIGVGYLRNSLTQGAELQEWHRHPKLVKIRSYPPKSDDEKATLAWMQNFTNNSSKKVPVEFYALAVDEDNKPLPGVIFGYNLDYHVPPNPEVSGNDGRVFISAPEGHQMELDPRPHKDGYWWVFDEAELHFVFDSCLDRDFYPSDPEHPVVYHFRKSLPEEPFYRWSRTYTTILGKVICIDLEHGDEIEDAKAPALTILAEEDPQGFSLTFGMNQGGVASGQGILDPLAPMSGYQPSIKLLYLGADFEDKTIFFVTPDNHYGSVTFKRPFIRNQNVEIDSTMVINPSGSRNLRTLGNAKQINIGY